MGYFSKFFPEWKPDTDVLGRSYPYSLRNSQRRVAKDKAKYESIRDATEGMNIKELSTLKVEALADGQMGSALLAGFIPDIFLDVSLFGARESIARRDFPLIGQSSNSSFKSRYMWRHDSAGIYHEGDDISAAVTKRLTEEFRFIKIADSMVYTRELLEDSPVSQVNLDVSMARNKISMLEDRCMWHEVTYLSDATHFPHWNEFNFQQATGNTADDIINDVGEAYLALTTRMEDQIDPGSLRLYISPTDYATLWNNEDYRRYDILGQSPTQVTGQIPPLFRIPTTIISPGYFGTDNEWHYQPHDKYLVASGAFAIRQRADIRMEPLTIQQRQMEGWLMSERIRPYGISPINFVRIGQPAGAGSGSTAVEVASIDEVIWTPRDMSKDDDNKAEMTIITATNAT